MDRPATAQHHPAPRMIRIAFVCRGNTGRSVTAEAVAKRHIAGAKLPVLVISRGLDVDPFEEEPEAAIATILAREGIDVGGHRARQLTATDVRHADLILTLTGQQRDELVATHPEAAGKTFALGHYASGGPEDIPDAWGKPMAFCEEMVGRVSALVPRAIERALATLS